MSNGTGALRYAIRLPVLGKYLGQLALMLALLLLAPVIVSLSCGEYDYTLRYGLLLVALLVVAVPLTRLPAPAQIQTNEALAIAALAFLITPLLMVFPLTAGGMPLADALFEAVSAVTTTGLSTLTGLAERPQTFLFARAWMQWYGGLGVVVLSVALLMGSHIGLRRLMESSTGEGLATSARIHARRTLVTYTVLTVLGIGVLWLMTGDGFTALTHGLAAISTGGFAPHDQSLAALADWPARYAVILLGLCGAIPLLLYFRAVHGEWRALLTDMELRALLLAILVISLVLGYFLSQHSGLPTGEAWRHAFLLGISAQTTSGFASMNPAGLDEASKASLIIAMLIGGGAGSTAGGIKLLRLLILLRLIQLIIQRTALPSHAVAEPRLGGRALGADEITRALVIILLYIGVVLLSWLVFLAYGYPALDALFEVASATGTVGLSVGVTQQSLPTVLKLVLCLDMWLGRLEIIALLIVLYIPNWVGKRRE